MGLRSQHTKFVVAISLAVLAVLPPLGGCERFYARQADKDAYGIIAKQHQRQFGTETSFTIDGGPSRNLGLTTEEILGDLPPAPPLPEMLAESELSRNQASLRQINVAMALRIGRLNSRDYQTQKENVYLAALALSTQRDAFMPQYDLTGQWDRIVAGSERDRSEASSADLPLSLQLATGTQLAMDVGLTGVRFLNHELGTTIGTVLGVTFDQPLWAGVDPRVVTSNLVQARHDVIYALRSFARYEKQYAVQVTSQYYTVLQSEDIVKNQWMNYNNLIDIRKRNEGLAKAGRLPMFQVDQARQDELQAHVSYLDSLAAYEQRLDDFRILLGLPADAPVVLTRQDFEDLAKRGTTHLDIDTAWAVREALARRLDLRNASGAVDDAERQSLVVADSLKGQLNLVASASVPSTPLTNSSRMMFHEGLYSYGVQVELPLKRVVQRNNYRASLIAYDATVRDYMDQVDQIKQGIRQSLRRLLLAEQSYEIQLKSEQLARQRVASTRMLLDAGRADTRDLLDSQASLVRAQNALSQALVSYYTARLDFLRDTEWLEVDEQGQIIEGNISGGQSEASTSSSAGRGNL